jgi:threonine synthase
LRPDFGSIVSRNKGLVFVALTCEQQTCKKGILNRYRSFFDITDEFPIVTLHEGNTPLISAPGIAAKTGAPGLQVFLKYEGLNPTGSFKDRGMTYAVSRAKAEGAEYIICASTGNTSASAAAYGARAGLQTLVILPEGKVALGKLSQALLYGSTIIEIRGNFDQALDIVREVGARSPKIAIVNSINPYRIEAQRTGAFEVCDELGDAPDFLFIPVGNAGNITAYWRGFKAYQAAGRSRQLPKMFGYEAEGSAAIVLNQKIEKPETIATAIRIGNPASWDGAVAARDESLGKIDLVTDDEILAAYRDLARLEGVFCEPSSAASVAGLYKAAAQGLVPAETKIVCVLTGNGLKDPDNAVAQGSLHVKRVSLDPTIEAVASFLGI